MIGSRYLAIAAALAALSACSSQPKIVGAAPPGIAYRVETGGIDAVQRRAEHYCQQYGKEASLQSVNDQGPGKPIARFSCS